jgi:hypothetical protein
VSYAAIPRNAYVPADQVAFGVPGSLTTPRRVLPSFPEYRNSPEADPARQTMFGALGSFVASTRVIVLSPEVYGAERVV